MDFHAFLHAFFDFVNHHENWKLQNDKTWVGFGRTEVSVRLDDIVICALLFGHGPSGWRYWGFKSDKIGNAFLK